MKGRVDYNRLIITVETDGTISPNDALKEAANILAQHFAWIADEISEKEIINTEETESTEISKETKIEDLPLSNRTINALTKNSIKTLAGLLKLSNEKLKDMDGLGDKSREEILEFVKKNDLQLKD